MPNFPTPIHLAVADPDDEGTTFLQMPGNTHQMTKWHFPKQFIL
jgi:hypothetical protein